MKRTPDPLRFEALPAFADYLLKQHLEAFCRFQIALLKKLNVPLLQSFAHFSDEQLLQFSMQTSAENLSYLAQNNARGQIDNSIALWKKNALPHISKSSIAAEDITYIIYVRKQSFLHFLPAYCADTISLLQLVGEIDRYLLEAETTSANVHIDLLKEELTSSAHLLEKINNTLPGAVYVFDVLNQKGVYANRNLGAIIGYAQDELNRLGKEGAIMQLLHPDDVDETTRQLQFVKNLPDGELNSYKYRVRGRDGMYHWIRNYEAVFKRTDDGSVWQTIGISLNVDKEERLAAALEESEAQYKKAEALANSGHYSYDIATKKLDWTDQLYTIYGLEPQSEPMTLQRFLSFIHPDDKEAVVKSKDRLFAEKKLDYSFRILTAAGEEKTLRSVAEVQEDENGRPVKVIGSEQDVTEKQNLINRLKQSDQLYKQAQALAHVGNWSWTIDTGAVEWSDELYRIYELPLGEPLTYDKIATFIHPAERAEIAALLQHCIETKSTYDKDHCIILRNGTMKTIHRRAEVQVDGMGKAVKMVGTTQDITLQKRIEQELRDNQIFIKKIADATPSIIALYNVNTGRYLFVSEGLKKLLGYETDAMMEQGAGFFASVVHPDDLDDVMQKNSKAVEEYNRPEHRDNNQAVVEFTYRMRHQNGTYRWFQTYGTIFDRNADGRIEHVLNISLDITEQMEARRIIEAQEHFIRHIADASPTILYLFDVPKAGFSYINREVYYVLGYTMEEVLQMNGDVVQALYHPEDRHLLPERKASGKQFQHSDSMMQYECRVRGKEGQWCWLLVREVVFETGEVGDVLQILGAALDITKRKDMEKTLLENALLLEQSNANLQEFAYVASHDLKEPLRKISTFGDRLVSAHLDKLPEDGKMYLRKIVDASQRMQVMINDLLSISLISGDRSFQTYSLQAVLEDVLQTLEFKIEQKGAVVESDGLPEARIVPSQFRQLFQNLISNSLKFVRDDVAPHITIKHCYLDQEQVTHLEGAARYLKLEFTDNGIGFEEEYAAKIFAIFQRLHGRSEYEGTGIGLAICKKIVEHHGGVIYANAAPGEGATFTVVLPA
jgi:PAS domain S-box-containing protein